MRKPWDQYFLDIARMVATRSTCDRLSVGSVIVRDRTILSTGYNGSMPGAPHCDDVGHLIVNNHCVRPCHSERNSILLAAKNGVSTKDAQIYVTALPCWDCFKCIVGAGIKTIYYQDEYRSDDMPSVKDIAKELHIELIKL